MTTLAWLVAWMASKQAETETREDYVSHFLADARFAELEAEGRPVVEYRIDLEVTP